MKASELPFEPDTWYSADICLGIGSAEPPVSVRFRTDATGMPGRLGDREFGIHADDVEFVSLYDERKHRWLLTKEGRL